MCTEGYSIVFEHFWGKLFPGILHVTSTNLIRSNLLSESISSCKFRMCEFHLCRLAHLSLKMWSNCKGLAHLWDFDLKVYKRLKVVFESIRKCFYSPYWKKRKKKVFLSSHFFCDLLLLLISRFQLWNYFFEQKYASSSMLLCYSLQICPFSFLQLVRVIRRFIDVCSTCQLN